MWDTCTIIPHFISYIEQLNVIQTQVKKHKWYLMYHLYIKVMPYYWWLSLLFQSGLLGKVQAKKVSIRLYYNCIFHCLNEHCINTVRVIPAPLHIVHNPCSVQVLHCATDALPMLLLFCTPDKQNTWRPARYADYLFTIFTTELQLGWKKEFWT